MVPDPPPPFDLHRSGVVDDQLRGLLRRARAAGSFHEVARQVAALQAELLSRPRTFGEIKNDYLVSQMEKHSTVFHGIRAVYSFHKRIPLVYLLDVRFAPIHELYEPELDDPMQ